MVKLRVRNVGLKSLSVALATLAWVLVSGDQVVERALRIRRCRHEYLPGTWRRG